MRLFFISPETNQIHKPRVAFAYMSRYKILFLLQLSKTGTCVSFFQQLFKSERNWLVQTKDLCTDLDQILIHDVDYYLKQKKFSNFHGYTSPCFGQL